MKYGWNVDCDFSFGALSREFHYANQLVDEIMAENLSNVKRLLQVNNANVNTVIPELGVAPLHLLAGMENEDFSSVVVLEALLRCGGDPNIRSEEGLTPVHVAAMWGRCRVLEILLANGGDPDLLDYKLHLNAEDYAINERQWKICGILSTFSVISESRSIVSKVSTSSKYLRDKHSTDEETDNCNLHRKKDQINDAKFSSKESARNDEYAIVLKGNARNNNQNRARLNESPAERSDEETYSRISDDSYRLSDDSHRVSDDNCRFSLKKNKLFNRKHRQTVNDSQRKTKSFTRKAIESLKLNDNAIRTIRDQRKKTHIYESISTNNLYSVGQQSQKDKRRKLHLYGDSVSESYDWIRRTDESTPLNEKAIATIKKQRLNSKIYQTKGLGEDPRKEREKEPPLYEESETCDWVDCKTDKNIQLDEFSMNRIKDYRMNTKIYQNCNPEGCSTLIRATPNKTKTDKNKSRTKAEESEMYFCGYSEQSFKPRERSHYSRFSGSSRSSTITNSTDFEECSIPNQKMLCKMSRIFLFMLKKRHIYQKIK